MNLFVVGGRRCLAKSGQICPLTCTATRHLADDKSPSNQAKSPKPQSSSTALTPDDRADFVPRVITRYTFPDPISQKLARGTGGRSSWNGQVVTVFGATGFFGRKLLTRLGRDGTQVVFPYRGDFYFPRRLKPMFDLGQLQYVPYDVRDVDSIYKAVKYSDVVINCIGKFNETPNFDFDAVHVEAARKIARVSREAGVKRLIHMSALNCSPNPKPMVLRKGSGFLRSKFYGELAVKEEFPEATIFRPSFMWGEEDQFLFTFAKWQRRLFHRLAIWNNGYHVYKQPVWVSDVVQGVYNSITDDDAVGRTYECFGPRRYELHDLAAYVNRCIQKEPDKGWRMKNLKFAPVMWLRISFLSIPWLHKYPVTCWQKIELEMVTDEPTGLPTLVDLGVSKQTPIEERLWYEMKIYRRFGNYPDETFEFLETPVPAPFTVTAA